VFSVECRVRVSGAAMGGSTLDTRHSAGIELAFRDTSAPGGENGVQIGDRGAGDTMIRVSARPGM
jgi:hypothetical protein